MTIPTLASGLANVKVIGLSARGMPEVQLSSQPSYTPASGSHGAELARQYELGGGISFRGLVDELRQAAEAAQAAEAPILEEDSDGVRMMTVHKAKGLEFPVVILADLTCKLSRPEAGRWIDPESNLCAVKIGGWAPTDLILHDAEEAARDRAEGLRLAYVAATRARDVLVVPTIGDEVYEGGWLDPLTPAVYPGPSERRTAVDAPGCPAFPSRDTVLNRPDGDPARAGTVSPGMYWFSVDDRDLAVRERGAVVTAGDVAFYGTSPPVVSAPPHADRFSLMPHTFLPATGSHARNSPRLPPGPALLRTMAPT